MKYHRLYHLNMPKNEAFNLLTCPSYLPRLFPAWSEFEVKNKPVLKKGEDIVVQLKTGPITSDWALRIEDFTMGSELFLKAQKSPFKLWEQYWRLKTAQTNQTAFAVDVRLKPKKSLYKININSMLKLLERNGVFRELRMNKDYEIKNKYPCEKPLKIVISGSHGLIGSELKHMLEGFDHEVFTLVRRKPILDHEIFWDIDKKFIELDKLEGMDAIIHLAGENIAEKRWTEKRKKELLENRTSAGKLIAESILKLNKKPKTYICASAIGYYTGLKEQQITETAPEGKGFATDLVKAIEEQASKVENAGIRTILPRFGAVLSPKGGALPKLIRPTQLGGAGPLGDGKQIFSWISIDDAVYALYHCLMTENVYGPVNVVAPSTPTQLQFIQHLAAILKRPCFLPMPSFIARLLFGQMAEELLLTGMDVVPEKLIDSGYEFMHSTPRDALHWVLGK